MQLLRISDVSFNKRDVVFRQSKLSLIAVCAVVLALMGGAYHLYAVEKLPKFMMIWIVFWLGIFFLMTFSALKKALKKSNWLMAFDGERLLLKFRSYLNTHFSDDDIQLVSISKSEIESVRVVKEIQRTKTMRGGSRTEKVVYLEFYLPRLELVDLKDAINDECKRKVNGLKYGHCPVIIKGQNKIRLVWGSSESAIQPGIKRAISLLSKQIRVEEELNLGILEPDVKDLLKQGKEIDAITLAKKKYGYTTAQAKEYVEGL